MPVDGPYEHYPVSGDEIRETTAFGRVSLAALGHLFDDFAMRHQGALAEVEGDVAAGLALGPGQAERQRLQLEQRAVVGMGGAEMFAGAVDAYDGDLQAWFRRQLAEGSINGLDDIPRSLDQRSVQLLHDPMIRRSMADWLHVDGARGEEDGSLVRDAETEGRRWDNLHRRVGWLSSFAAQGHHYDDEFTEDQLDYLTAFYRQAYGYPISFNDVAGVNAIITSGDGRFAATFADGLVALVNGDVDGGDDRLPQPVVEAIDPDASEHGALEDLLEMATTRPIHEGSRLDSVLESPYYGG